MVARLFVATRARTIGVCRFGSRQRQEQAVAVLHDDLFGERALIALLERNLPQITIGLLAALRFDALEIDSARTALCHWVLPESAWRESRPGGPPHPSRNKV